MPASDEIVMITTPLAFFESIHHAYLRAELSAGGAIDRYYAIGGYNIHLKFAGPALVPLITPALEHLAIFSDTTKADLTICLWDSVSTATTMPPRPWELGDQLAGGEVRGFNNTRIHTMLSGDVGAVNILDEEENIGVYWIREACDVPTYERGAPLRAIIHWWMRQHRRFLVHAGTVGYQESGMLLAGRGGSGKSTCTLACVLADWQYVGDDYCLLAPDGVPFVYSLYNSAKLDAIHLKNFPALLSAISNPDKLTSEKALLYLYQHQPRSLSVTLPVRVLFLPRVTARTATIATLVTPAEALLAFAPSSLFQLPGTGKTEFRALADLVRKVPCYRLELGTELGQIPEAMIKALRQ